MNPSRQEFTGAGLSLPLRLREARRSKAIYRGWCEQPSEARCHPNTDHRPVDRSGESFFSLSRMVIRASPLPRRERRECPKISRLGLSITLEWLSNIWAVTLAIPERIEPEFPLNRTRRTASRNPRGPILTFSLSRIPGYPGRKLWILRHPSGH